MKKSKKAISPIITTILLIVLALVLALIILLWARGFMTEQVAKFDAPIENSCKDVNLQASVSDDSITLSNMGNVPVYKIGIKVSSAGSSGIEYKEVNLVQGGSSTITSTKTLTGNSVELVPVLLGKSQKTGETKEYNCLNNLLTVTQ